MDEAIAAWRAVWDPQPPIGHRMRWAFPDRTFRVHSFPDSTQRYPKDARDVDEMLQRHELVAGLVLGIGAPCIAFSFVRNRPVDAGWSTIAIPGAWILDDDVAAELATASLAVRRLTWSAGVLRDEMVAVANDETRFAVLSLQTGGVYAPYDGGADLFVARPSAPHRDDGRVGGA